MARFFQHLEPGDLMGKVTQLKYIDDISDDELTLYYFADGTKCSSEFIATPEEDDPIAAKKVMVELTGPTNQWVFEKHEIIPDEDRVIVGADGVRYQAPDPTVKFAGGPGARDTTVAEGAKSGIRLETKRPKKLARYTIEPDEMYTLSAHPELENGAAPVQMTPKKVVSQPRQTPVKKRGPVTGTVEIDETKTPLQPKQEMTDDFNFDEEIDVSVKTTQKPITTRPEIRIPQNHTQTFNLDVTPTNDIEFILGGKKLTFEQLKKKLSEPQQTATPNNLSEIFENEDVLIKNMIDKSKKNMCKISMSLNLNIPPQEVYDTIKLVYGEDMLEGFVKSLTARYLSQDNMLTSISAGLKAYYEKNSKKKDSN